ncbi:MAG: hypothetical protein WEB04_02030 [Dehalococcoidia bacterium]
MIAYGSAGNIEIYDLSSQTTNSLSPADLGLPDAVYVDAPAWSPTTDELVVYFAQSEGPVGEEEPTTQGYAVVSLVGRQAVSVMQYQAQFLPAQSAQWSPDGTRILINLISSAKYANPAGLWVVSPSGDDLRQVDDVVAYRVLWAPSGKAIAYIDNDTRRVFVLEANSLQVVEQPESADPVADIAWRPTAP